jgi:hypothetical protein
MEARANEGARDLQDFVICDVSAPGERRPESS